MQLGDLHNIPDSATVCHSLAVAIHRVIDEHEPFVLTEINPTATFFQHWMITHPLPGLRYSAKNLLIKFHSERDRSRIDANFFGEITLHELADANRKAFTFFHNAYKNRRRTLSTHQDLKPLNLWHFYQDQLLLPEDILQHKIRSRLFDVLINHEASKIVISSTGDYIQLEKETEAHCHLYAIDDDGNETLTQAFQSIDWNEWEILEERGDTTIARHLGEAQRYRLQRDDSTFYRVYDIDTTHLLDFLARLEHREVPAAIEPDIDPTSTEWQLIAANEVGEYFINRLDHGCYYLPRDEDDPILQLDNPEVENTLSSQDSATSRYQIQQYIQEQVLDTANTHRSPHNVLWCAELPTDDLSLFAFLDTFEKVDLPAFSSARTSESDAWTEIAEDPLATDDHANHFYLNEQTNDIFFHNAEDEIWQHVNFSPDIPFTNRCVVTADGDALTCFAEGEVIDASDFDGSRTLRESGKSRSAYIATHGYTNLDVYQKFKDINRELGRPDIPIFYFFYHGMAAHYGATIENSADLTPHMKAYVRFDETDKADVIFGNGAVIHLNSGEEIYKLVHVLHQVDKYKSLVVHPAWDTPLNELTSIKPNLLNLFSQTPSAVLKQLLQGIQRNDVDAVIETLQDEHSELCELLNNPFDSSNDSDSDEDQSILLFALKVYAHLRYFDENPIPHQAITRVQPIPNPIPDSSNPPSQSCWDRFTSCLFNCVTCCGRCGCTCCCCAENAEAEKERASSSADPSSNSSS